MMKENYVLIGAGSVSFSRGLYADLIRRGVPCNLALVDINPEALAVAERVASKMIEATKAPIGLRATIDRREVLKEATAVISTIGVGGRRAWEQDVFIPRKYGIYQPVGDSVMPGGTSRALRMIPAMVAIAEDVLDLAPDALFINYANPMSVICRAVRKATGAKVIGLCHGVNHVSHYLASVLGVQPDSLSYTSAGINHLTWFTHLSAGNEDLMPCLQTIARNELARGVDLCNLGSSFVEAGGAVESAGNAAVDNPFSWQLTELFGAYPAVMDRHVTEFFPHMFCRKGAYFGKTLGVDAYSFEGTIAHGDLEYEKMCELAFSPHPLPGEFMEQTSGEHEQAIEIIDSIRSDERKVYSANIPNTGQVPNLPPESVIECLATAGREGMKPLQTGPLPAPLAGILASRFQWVEAVVEAALEGSRTKFIQALILDGAVDSVQKASSLADDLLAEHAEYLPQFDLCAEQQAGV